MPQLDFANPMVLAQAVWLLIIFGLLYYVLSNTVLPQVASVLEDRASRIAADLDAARASKSAADLAFADMQAANRKARAEAQAAIAAAVADANAAAQTRAEALNARLAEQISTAEARIAASRDAAMSALRGVAVDTTTALVTRLTGRVDAAAVDGAVGRVLSARGIG